MLSKQESMDIITHLSNNEKMNTLSEHHPIHLWITELHQGSAASVTALYSPNGVLVPTLSNRIRYNHAAIKDYFDSFLSKKPHCSIESIESTSVSDNTILCSGIYQFTFNDETTSRARFSFVFTRDDDRWYILQHHSSLTVV